MSNFVYLKILRAENLVSIFDNCVEDYHKLDDVNQQLINQGFADRFGE